MLSWVCPPFVAGHGAGRPARRSFLFPDGRVDEGPLVEGKAHGHWTESYPSGEVWAGPMFEGKRHGHWVRTAGGSCYINVWRHGDRVESRHCLLPEANEVFSYEEQIFSTDEAPSGIGEHCRRRLAEAKETTMTNPTPERPRDMADMTPEERERLYRAAMAAGDVDAAEALVHGPLPPDWPEDARRPWGARRDLSPCSGGPTGPPERPHVQTERPAC